MTALEELQAWLDALKPGDRFAIKIDHIYQSGPLLTPYLLGTIVDISEKRTKFRVTYNDPNKSERISPNCMLPITEEVSTAIQHARLCRTIRKLVSDDELTKYTCEQLMSAVKALRG